MGWYALAWFAESHWFHIVLFLFSDSTTYVLWRLWWKFQVWAMGFKSGYHHFQGKYIYMGPEFTKFVKVQSTHINVLFNKMESGGSLISLNTILFPT